MESSGSTPDAFLETVRSYRKMIDETVMQLSDEEFFLRPSEQTNSVAVILRHLGGNLLSRWTEFRTTDGEKESRDRDAEFSDWEGSRTTLMEYFDLGWKTLVAALSDIDENEMQEKITIRGESHSILQAVIRSVTHVSYHVGQITLTARSVHEGKWNWLTIAPNQSGEFNRTTWGTSKSRAVFDTDSTESS